MQPTPSSTRWSTTRHTENLAKADRMSIHTRIVDALLAQGPEFEKTEPALLAYHCEAASLVARAADYYDRAGQRSVERGALSEAEKQFEGALRLISALPPGAARDHAEMRSLRRLNYVQQVHWGYTRGARRPVLDRMAELFARLGEPPEFFIALYHRWVFFINRGEFTGALRVTADLYRCGERHHDRRGQLLGLLTGSLIHTLRGELLDARADLERLLELHATCEPFRETCGTRRQDSAGLTRYGSALPSTVIEANPHLFLALVLAWLGYRDQAIAHAELGLERSKFAGSVSIDIEYLAMSDSALDVSLGAGRSVAADREAA